MTSRLDFLLLLFAATVFLSDLSVEQLLFSPVDDDYGNLTNCGDKSTNFLLRWTPRVIKSGLAVTFDLTWTFVASFGHGNLTVTIWKLGYVTPILNSTRDQDCEAARKAIQQFFPIQCPVPQGFHVKFSKEHTFNPSTPLPIGKFKVHLELMNQDAKQLACAEGIIELGRE